MTKDEKEKLKARAEIRAAKALQKANAKAKSGFFLVREEILPEAIKKTIRVKECLKQGEVRTINEAVALQKLSRSAYYKYKDYVFPFYEISQNKIITLTLLLEHKQGILSSVLNAISDEGGNILTINQGIPLQGVANATFSIETKNMTVELESLLDKLRNLKGVKRLEIVGQE
ncbi:ACT domain-containing protein [Selenomonas sp. TAMA-11512]|uniref:ACT domain-containing protein n=1 Tax=Selenomonas sp. TAMA-11512 TaxID=3095337 RepID=UPI003089888F|nr:ACT domain-containing protein [Selenomonas sp. TAMA-11512]